MENVIIDQRIVVAAVFMKDMVKPKWFVWSGRKYDIKEVTYTWDDTDGNARIKRFAVSDGSTLFELSLNLNTLEWRLEKSVIE
ncbi:MAG: hypothetical protein ABSH12_07750 [Endomicrobiales bacterium]|jgi:hypothetical protein